MIERASPQRLVRWTWVIVLVPLTLLALALAPVTGLLTLPFGLMTGGLAFIFAHEARGEERPRWAVITTLLGLLGTVLLLIIAVVTA